MALVRIILTALFAFVAMLAGLVVALFLMAVGALARLFGGGPVLRGSVKVNRAAGPPPARSPDRHDPDVIEVEATTVAPDATRTLGK